MITGCPAAIVPDVSANRPPYARNPMQQSIEIEARDGRFSAYVARPATSPSAAIVVVQELLGVNADLRATCDELAAQGYLALSPDLFWRLERNVDLSDRSESDWRHGMELYAAFDYDAGVDDVARTLAAARERAGESARVGLMGFCLGGLMTFLTTARRGADASVIYYGGNTDRHLDEAPRIRTPLLVHLGEEDEYIPKAAQRAIADALRDHRDTVVHTYPGRRHAFARHGGAHYDADAAALANARTAEFFRTYLEAGGAR